MSDSYLSFKPIIYNLYQVILAVEKQIDAFESLEYPDGDAPVIPEIPDEMKSADNVITLHKKPDSSDD